MVPTVLNTIRHELLALGKVMLHVTKPSVTVTVPVGVPDVLGVTLTGTCTLCPANEGSGASETIAVVVAAGVAVCAVPLMSGTRVWRRMPGITSPRIFP